MIFWELCMNRHTHLGKCRQQLCSLGLKESLGLPDLYSSRKLPHIATERTKPASLSLCSIWLFSSSYLFIALCTHAHIVKVKKLWWFLYLKISTLQKKPVAHKSAAFWNGNDWAHLHGLHAPKSGIAPSKLGFSNENSWSKAIFTILQGYYKHQGKSVHSISGNCYKRKNVTQSFG